MFTNFQQYHKMIADYFLLNEIKTLIKSYLIKIAFVGDR